MRQVTGEKAQGRQLGKGLVSHGEGSLWAPQAEGLGLYPLSARELLEVFTQGWRFRINMEACCRWKGKPGGRGCCGRGWKTNAVGRTLG